jgi:ElaB/YqjD/DUF883 family membrane-anchored ribosome-binding protein
VVTSNENYSSVSSGASELDPASAVGRAASAAHQTVDTAAESAQAGVDRLEDACASMCEAPKSIIRANPFTAVVLAFSLGYLIGKI